MTQSLDEARRIAEGQQRAVVDHRGAAYVEACPGSGKTQTVARRLAVAAPRVLGRQGIAVISFTNMAVDEFRERCVLHQCSHHLRYPSFLGTFDRFIFQFIVAPSGIPGTTVALRLVDNWDGITVNVGGVNLPPIPLDCFDAKTGLLDLEELPHHVSKPTAEANREKLQARARQVRRGLARRGFISTDECRLIALSNISDLVKRQAISQALAARFSELVIDEAQDCNDTDIEILKWLHESGIPIVIVCDPDQAIFGFRGASRVELAKFAAQFPRLPMEGNFRSTPIICQVASTMRPSRPTPDLPVGPNAAHPGAVRLIGLTAGDELRTAGERFIALLAQETIDLSKAIVLAHQRRVCASTAGASVDDSGSAGMAARLARAVSEIRGVASDPTDRGRGLRHLMRLVLEVEGKILDGETFAEALERYGERDLRRRALGLFEAVDAIPVDDGEVWLNRVHVTVERCLTLPANKTIKQAFRKVALDECVGTLGRPAPTTLRWATIHEAKGRDYDAVCLVVPRPRKPLPDVVDLWEAGVDDEALRVLYVGATRAKRLLALAIEADDRLGRVRAILDKHAVPHEAA